jgi:hypothetical protein
MNQTLQESPGPERAWLSPLFTHELGIVNMQVMMPWLLMLTFVMLMIISGQSPAETCLVSQRQPSTLALENTINCAEYSQGNLILGTVSC